MKADRTTQHLFIEAKDPEPINKFTEDRKDHLSGVWGVCVVHKRRRGHRTKAGYAYCQPKYH
jgi:hypothetical protein